MDKHSIYQWIFDANMWLYIILPLLVGILMGVKGWYMRKKKETVSTSERWMQEMQKWQIVEKEDELPIIAQTIQCYWNRFILSSLYLCLGVTLVVLTIGGALISFLITRNPIGLVTKGSDLQILILALVFLIGSGSGIIIGIWQMRRQAVGKVNYGDVRQRRVSDYRSSIFVGCIAVSFIMLCAVTVFFAPFMGPFYLQLTNGQKLILPNNSSFLCIVPCLMVCFIVLLEWFMVCVVAQPRFLILPNPAVSQRTDDVIRSWLIGLLQGEEFWVIGILYQFQYRLLWSGHIALLDNVMGLEIMLFTIFLLGWFFMMCGFLCYISHGQLYGRVKRRIGNTGVMYK